MVRQIAKDKKEEKEDERPRTALGVWLETQVKRRLGFIILPELTQFLPPERMGKFYDLAVQTLREQTNFGCIDEGFLRENIAAILRLHKGDKVKYTGVNGAGVRAERRLTIGNDYTLLEEPQIYAGTGHVSLFIQDDGDAGGQHQRWASSTGFIPVRN